MRSCDEMLELISAALDDALDDGERLELEAHLETCPGCRALLAELRGLHEALETPVEAPDGFAQRLMAQIAAQSVQEETDGTLSVPAPKTVHIFWKKWAACAAVAAVVILGAVALPGQLRLGSANSGYNQSTGAAAPANEGAAGEWGDLDVNFQPECYSSLENQPDAPAGSESEKQVIGDAMMGTIGEGGDGFSVSAAIDSVADMEHFYGVSDAEPASTAPDRIGGPTSDSDLRSDPTSVPESTAAPVVYCGVLLLNGEPLPEGLEDYEAGQDEAGNLTYVVPASYFFSNAAVLKAENASNFADLSAENAADPDAEYGLIIVDPDP